MHAYIHTYAHTHVHTYIHTHTHTYIHTCIYMQGRPAGRLRKLDRRAVTVCPHELLQRRTPRGCCGCVAPAARIAAAALLLPAASVPVAWGGGERVHTQLASAQDGVLCTPLLAHLPAARPMATSETASGCRHRRRPLHFGPRKSPHELDARTILKPRGRARPRKQGRGAAMRKSSRHPQAPAVRRPFGVPACGSAWHAHWQRRRHARRQFLHVPSATKQPRDCVRGPIYYTMGPRTRCNMQYAQRELPCRAESRPARAV